MRSQGFHQYSKKLFSFFRTWEAAISGVVPLGETFGYATDLRSMTQGRATYTLQFAHYAAAPQAVKDVMIRKAS